MKLLAALALAACFTILPSYVTAEETWKKGDKVAAFFICKEEKDIMDIALADSKGVQNFLELVIKKQLTRGCIPLRPPALFIVDEVIGSYKDYKNEKSLIMKIVSPKNNLLAGYIVAAGIPDKGI
tara:strand:- start:1673 stop:2047 length:375 start_codon:yes stop_codon:yes gene_type:complete